MKLLDHSRSVDWLAILTGRREEPYSGETLCADFGEDLLGLVIGGGNAGRACRLGEQT